MRKDKLYFLTFISIAVIFLMIASIAVKYFVKVSANQLIELQLESSKRESNEISKLIYNQIALGIDKEKVTNNVQQAIQGIRDEVSYVTVFDWSGREVCHPDVTQIGQKVNSNQTLLNSLKEDDSSNDLYDLLMSTKDSSNDSSEIIHISAVSNSDLIVAAYISLDRLGMEVSKLKKSFYTIFILMGVFIILASFFAVRMIGSYYEKQLELKNSNLENELLNLSKLNTDLLAYQQKIVKDKEEQAPIIEEIKAEPSIDVSKKRILTYIRNELVPIEVDKIAYIYTENTITYVVSSNQKKSTTNASLDDLYASLDTLLFFRANRQYIISIIAIKKIIKYGNSQLKIVVDDANAEIIISKNKAAEFRQWLNI